MMARKLDKKHIALTDEEIDFIAEPCHGAYAAYVRAAYGEDAPAWADLDDKGRAFAREGVRRQFDELRLYTAADLHSQWMDRKAADGWKYGPVKDAAAKTHPSMVPYAELPNEEKQKDALFSSVAGSLYYLVQQKRASK